jgi:hypothetical protein
LKPLSIYSIPCKCGKVYIGQTGCSSKTRSEEHHWHITLYKPDKSALAQHSINLGHCIQFLGTSILVKKSELWNALSWKRETGLYPDSMNREGFS